MTDRERRAEWVGMLAWITLLIAPVMIASLTLVPSGSVSDHPKVVFAIVAISMGYFGLAKRITPWAARRIQPHVDELLGVERDKSGPS